MDKRQTKRKTKRRSSSVKDSTDENDVERLLPSQLATSSTSSDPNSQMIFLDEMIRQSRDDLLRSSQKRKQEASSSNKYHSTSYPSSSLKCSRKTSIIFANINAHLGLVMTLHPRITITCIVCLLSLCVVLFFQIAERNKFVNELIDTDYTDIKSVYDLSVGNIDHWCLNGDDDSCDCEDPLEPISRGELKQWVKAHNMNKEAVSSAISSIPESLDVAFLGESIVEEWNGRSIGRNNTKYTKVKESFQEHFNGTNNGEFNGVALGIHGDTSPNVLWRLLHGEIEKKLNPKVWWLVLGTNDLAIQQCSEEVVLLGILRVIEEIMSQKPTATIIVNSILPMTLERDGRLMDIKDKHKVENEYEYKNEQENLVEDSSISNDMLKITIDDVYGKSKILDKSEATIDDIYGKSKILENNGNRKTSLFSFSKPKNMLWLSVSAINKQLKAFCDKNEERLIFFNADDIFVDQFKNELNIKSDLLNSRGHPNQAGHELWHKEIVRTLSELI